jgi:hypothetical protein
MDLRSVRSTGMGSLLALMCSASAGAQSPADRRDLSNVRVDCVSFDRWNSSTAAISGRDCGTGRERSIAVAPDATVFGATARLESLRPGDEVTIRSTFADSGAVVHSEIDVNVTAFDVMVTRLTGDGFAFIKLDYSTGLPLRSGSDADDGKTTGVAVVPPSAVISSNDGRGRPVRSGDIAVGDRAKLYGFKRADSARIDVYRIEDRGRS